MTVTDDGKGFDSQAVRGMGLLGMEERVTHLGGTFQVKSTPGRGASLHIDLPLTPVAAVQPAAKATA
jgi:signal transduction histidine kinase